MQVDIEKTEKRCLMDELKNILETIPSMGLWVYILVINIVTFCAFAADKVKAMTDAWRISEKTLLTLSVMGGAAGGWLAMQLCRHKTQTPIFKFGMPVIVIIHIVILTKFFMI